MGSRRSAFKQADLARALKAAASAGLKVARYEIEPNGRIAILTSEDAAARIGGANEWDEVLK